MKDAQILFELLMSQPLVAAAIAFIAVIFAALLKAATVAAEVLTKRWLTPAPVPPIFPGDPDDDEKAEEAPPRPNFAPRELWSLKMPFAAALVGGLAAALIWATWSVDTFEGRDANGQACVGTSLFGFENGSCIPITNHFEGIEGF